MGVAEDAVDAVVPQRGFLADRSVVDSPIGLSGNAGGAVAERTDQDDLDHAPSARVTLEVRILDATVRSRQQAPKPPSEDAPSGSGPLVVVLAADRDLCGYLYSHLAEVKAWRVVAADNPGHALMLLQVPSEHRSGPVLVLDAPDLPLLAQLPPALAEKLRVALLADEFPPEFARRVGQHTLVPWPLDMPTLVQHVAHFVGER